MKRFEMKLYKSSSKVKIAKPLKRAITFILFSILKRKDPYTAEHCERVMHLTVGYAKHYNYPFEQVHSLKYASLLHDIGKIAVSKNILHKPGKLDEDEFVQIRKHPFTGFLILSKIAHFQQEAAIIRDHHERIDGSGYPFGLHGHQINELSKVLSVCDAFDAMTEYRIYREPLPFEDALKELLRNAESQFDRVIVERFCSYMQNSSTPHYFYGLYKSH